MLSTSHNHTDTSAHTFIIEELQNILRNLADWLDIPETYFELANSRYHSIGSWLGRPESIVSAYQPEIFPQGSFRLGTVTKPATNDDEYDIDLVCKLRINQEGLSQKQLKEIIGEELKNYRAARNILSPVEERRRCWRLNYSDSGAKFHLDALPAILANPNFRNQTIAITDNQLSCYSSVNCEWPCCDPVGYADWFEEQMKITFERKRREIAESLKVHAEDVPRHKVKTPLQRSVQILKRHRDITFKGHIDDKPISILITTLAAHSYDNEENIVEALVGIVTKMSDFIEKRDGIYWIENPVNLEENFADKWEQYPNRAAAFFDWLDEVRMDILNLCASQNIVRLNTSLKSQFGEVAIQEATKSLPEFKATLLSEKASNRLTSINRTQVKFSVPHRQEPLWSMNLNEKVYISAVVTKKGFRPKTLLSTGTVSKHCSLQFTANTTVTKGHSIYWQVVNTGYEAHAANGLRGGFYSSSIHKGRKVRKESSLYEGIHWVECFVIKDGTCIARSGEFIINIV